MPITEGRYDNVKVYRPSGTPFAKGTADGLPAWGDPEFPAVTEIVVSYAVRNALRAFHREFERPVNAELLVVEVACDSSGAKATVFEIKDPEDD